MNSKSIRMDRRRFLQTSGAALATAAVVPAMLANELSMHPKRLSVGFAPIDGDGRVVPASSIPSGDGAFIRTGARITILGTSGSAPAQRRTVELVAHYGINNDDGTRTYTPFRAWGCSRGVTGCPNKAYSFNVPVDEEQRVLFSVMAEDLPVRGEGLLARYATTDAAPAAPPVALPIALSLQSDPGSIKLARGYYFLAPLFEGDSEPAWSSCELQTEGPRVSLVERGLFESRAAQFEHFVLRVDYVPEKK